MFWSLYTDKDHCIVTETFDTNLNLVVIQWVRDQKKSHINISLSIHPTKTLSELYHWSQLVIASFVNTKKIKNKNTCTCVLIFPIQFFFL